MRGVFLKRREDFPSAFQRVEGGEREQLLVGARLEDRAKAGGGTSAPKAMGIPRLQHKLRHAAAHRDAHERKRSGGLNYFGEFPVEYPGAVGTEFPAAGPVL